METWFSSWWRNTSKSLKIMQIIALIAMIALIISFIGGYFFNWTWTGFGPYIPPTSNFQREKTLYDWLQLLIVPLALATIALLFNRATTRTEQDIAKKRYEQDQAIAEKRYEQDQKIAAQRDEQDQKIARDKQREDLLQTYLDRMTELLLEKQLRTSAPSDEVRNVARVRTITVLFQLDARRLGYVFAFLRETGLMSTTSESIVSLKQAELNKINLSQARLSQADLSEASLFEANLSGAILSKANLSKASLF